MRQGEIVMPEAPCLKAPTIHINARWMRELNLHELLSDKAMGELIGQLSHRVESAIAESLRMVEQMLQLPVRQSLIYSPCFLFTVSISRPCNVACTHVLTDTGTVS